MKQSSHRKANPAPFHLHESLEWSSSWRHKVEQWLPGAGAQEGAELVSHGDRVSVGKDQRVLETDGGDGCTMM